MRYLEWCHFSQLPVLQKGEIHIWYVTLDEKDRWDKCCSILSGDERARATRLISQTYRSWFAQARACLRMILALYTNNHPASIRFGYSSLGKPYLLSEESTTSLEFSVAHKQGNLAAAFSSSGRVGIDLEFLQPIEGRNQIIRRYFSENDQTKYNLLADENRIRAFLTAWTRKEALGKALGRGLADSGNKDYLFPEDDQPMPDRQIEVLKMDGWWWLRFQPDAAYITTAAVEMKMRPEFSFWKTSIGQLAGHLNERKIDNLIHEPLEFLWV